MIAVLSNKGNMSDDYLLQEIRTGSSHNMLLSASLLLLITAVGKILNICNYSIVPCIYVLACE